MLAGIISMGHFSTFILKNERYYFSIPISKKKNALLEWADIPFEVSSGGYAEETYP